MTFSVRDVLLLTAQGLVQDLVYHKFLEKQVSKYEAEKNPSEQKNERKTRT